MDPGYYAACTAMMAQAQSLELVANNLANTNTAGYRGQHSVFRATLAASGHPLTEVNMAANNYGVLEGSRLDLSQGGLQTTGNELDTALEGPGFFAVQTANGTMYTRNGSFHLDKDQLVTTAGDPVLGEKGAIRIPSGGPISIGPDGTISVNGAVAGKLNVVEFAPGTQIQSVGKTYYSAPNGTSSAAKRTQVRQGTLEASNVDAVMGAMDLITVQRSMEMMQRALTIFDAQFNRTAVEDIPRVT
jgi:flagellar basal-body rod protein FlgF/flagellar basal-body rod protein FlgG